MKLLTVRDFRNKSARIWKDLKKEREMLITSNGKPVAVLMPAEDNDFEETVSMVRQARAMKAACLLHIDAMKNGTSRMSMEEINKEIALARPDKHS